MTNGRVVRILGCMGALVSCLGAWEAVRLAHADRLGESDSVREVARATLLAPGNPRYWLRLADLREAAGEAPGEARERALSAGPRDAAAWIAAGLRAEMDGDVKLAERQLLRAAGASRQYQPRWTLAGFYFRHGRREEFWRWAGSAAKWSHGNRAPLFRMAVESGETDEAILQRLCGDDRGILSAYLSFLITEGRAEAAEGCAARLGPRAGREDRGVLIRFGEEMLGRGRFRPALGAWKALCERGLVPYPAPDAAAGRPLSNGDFGEAPLGGGFDWRFPAIDGTSVTFYSKPGLARIAFTGRQPENCEPLGQYMPVSPGRTHRLRFEYRSEEIAEGSGPRWAMRDAERGTAMEADSPTLASAGWKTETARFAVPRETRWVRLALGCRRASGAVRVAGTMWLRRISMETER